MANIIVLDNNRRRAIHTARRIQAEQGGKIKYIRQAVANMARGVASNGPTHNGGPEAA